MMRPFGFGLAVAVLFSAIVGASTASAAAKDDPVATAGDLLQQKGIPCTVVSARVIVKDADMSDGAKASFFEAACKDSLGYVVIKRSKEPLLQAEDCLVASKPGADGKPSKLACKLPENVSPNGALSAALTKLGRNCDVDKYRSIGQTPTLSIVETSCQGGEGYILMLPIAAGVEASANPCIGYDELVNAQLKCEITTPQQRDAHLQTLVSAGGKPCTMKSHRFIGTTSDHSTYLEVACTEGKGYVIQADAGGKFMTEIDCGQAGGIAGGCTMTDTRAAQTEQNAVYTKLAKKAGFDCTVSKYAAFAVDTPSTDVVELQCSNRPDGGVGIFPATGPGKVLNCVRSEADGYHCSFTDPAAVYPALFAQLKAKGKTSCVVNGARSLGKTKEGETFIEVACSDGGPGWVLDYPPNAEQPSSLLNCAQAAGLGGSGGGGCQLPTNVKH